MNIEDLHEYCLSKKAATESFPFDETTLVFKVMNKMFAVTDLEEELAVVIKCELFEGGRDGRAVQRAQALYRDYRQEPVY